MGCRALSPAVDVHRRAHRALRMPTLDLTGIDKSFDGTAALREASLHVPPGTIHALLGENGAGKTTLMRIAFGMLQPDSGSISLDGQPCRFDSPAQAIAAGIGMIHQHFALVHAMTVAENVALGGSGRYRHRTAVETVKRLAAETGLHLEPDAHVAELGIGGQQRVEILKALARNARILILDEPTAVLPPSEAASLLDWIRNFAQEGRSAVLITHKVREALRIADHVTVLRRGRVALSKAAAGTSEDELAHAMIEQTPPPIREGGGTAMHPVVVTLDHVTVSAGDHVTLQPTSLTVRGGEILGVAGVERSGYRELLRVLAGRALPTRGRRVGPETVGFIPEDRHREALSLDMTSAENVALRGAGERHGMMNWATIQQHTRELATSFDVRGPVPHAATRMLSGGNQQKLVLARELNNAPPLVVAENPTRGLDLLASAAVLRRLSAARDHGAAVVIYSTELEELLSIADRMVVIHGGHVMEVPLRMEAIAAALVGIAA